MQKTIQEYMTELPHTVGEGTTAEKAMEMMKEYHCHHLPVLDGGKLVGMISQRDLTLAGQVSSLSEVSIKNIMNDEPLVVGPTDTVKQVIDSLIDNNYGSAIISARDNSKWGIFTVTDALKLLRELV